MRRDNDAVEAAGSKEFQRSDKTPWSGLANGKPPEFWHRETAHDGDMDVALNGKRSFFSDDSDEDIATRLWGATLYARERRYFGPESMLLTSIPEEMVWRALYGYCVENASSLRQTLETRGFETRCIAVMTEPDIENLLGGDQPETVKETSFRHYLVQAKCRIPERASATWVTCDSALYTGPHEGAPYVAPKLPEYYAWFPDSVTIGESVLANKDPAYCIGEVTESDYE